MLCWLNPVTLMSGTGIACAVQINCRYCATRTVVGFAQSGIHDAWWRGGVHDLSASAIIESEQKNKGTKATDALLTNLKLTL
jgi:hypothetical protein